MTNRDSKFTLLIYSYDVSPTIFCYLVFIRASSTLASVCATTTALHIVLEAAQVESKNLAQTSDIQAEKGFQHHWWLQQNIWWYLFWLCLSHIVCFNYSLVCCVFKLQTFWYLHFCPVQKKIWLDAFMDNSVIIVSVSVKLYFSLIYFF